MLVRSRTAKTHIFEGQKVVCPTFSLGPVVQLCDNLSVFWKHRQAGGSHGRCIMSTISTVFISDCNNMHLYDTWGGGSAAAAVTLDSVADESRKKMADSVTRSPSRLCSRDGKIFFAMETP